VEHTPSWADDVLMNDFVNGALKLTPAESVAIVACTTELLEVTVRYEANGRPPPKHLHPSQDEHFEVLEGEVTVCTPSGKRVLKAGETIDITRRTPHQLWNGGSVPAIARWQTCPAGRTKDWFEAIDRIHRSGRVGRSGMPGPLAYGAMLTRYRDVFRLAVAPDFVTRPALALLGVFGRVRGY